MQCDGRVSLLLLGMLWRNKHAPHISFPMNHVDGGILRIFLPLEPLVGAVQPLHLKCTDRDPVTHDHQLIDAFLVVIAVEGSERLMHPNRDIEPTFSSGILAQNFPSKSTCLL